MCHASGYSCSHFCRLLEYAPSYYDLSTFTDGETKRALVRVQNKRSRKAIGLESESRGGSEPPKKKRK